MQSEYPIQLEGKYVGSSVLTRQGMYYIIRCSVNPQVPQPCRITISGGMEDIDLGICIAGPEGYGLTARLPVKKILPEQISFHIRRHSNEPGFLYCPIKETEPFSHIAQLKNARFTIENGKPGIIVPIFKG